MNKHKDKFICVNIALPICLYKFFRRIKHCLFRSSSMKKNNQIEINLVGDRDVEWSWVASQMSSGPGEALDFGSGGSCLSLIAVREGFNVTGVDLEPALWSYDHHRLRFIQGDILKLPLPTNHFALVINCSTVEHVGLTGRYGVVEDNPDGDLEVMSRLKELMKSGAVMLLTIPIGQDAVFTPLHRIYGKERLSRLLEGYIVEKEEFWVKDQRNRWVVCDKQTALNFKASSEVYALGCFVLRKSYKENS